MTNDRIGLWLKKKDGMFLLPYRPQKITRKTESIWYPQFFRYLLGKFKKKKTIQADMEIELVVTSIKGTEKRRTGPQNSKCKCKCTPVWLLYIYQKKVWLLNKSLAYTFETFLLVPRPTHSSALAITKRLYFHGLF